MNLYQPTITGSLSVSGSVNISGSISIAGGGTISGTASIATTALTASSADNFLVRNTLTAQTLVVQTITSSVDFVTGSTRFGSLLTNTHVFSGSVTMNPGGLFVSSSGNVGIGTTSPSVQLDVASTSRFNSAGNWMQFETNVLTSLNNDGAHIRSVISTAANPTYTWKGDTDTGIYSDTANTIGFSTSGSNRLTIASTGAATFSNSFTTSDTPVLFLSPNLGTNQSLFLQLGKNISSTYNSGEVSFKYVGNGSTSNMVSLGFYGSGQKLNVLGDGNVGIGITPSYKLDVNRGSSGVVLNLEGTNAYDAETGILMSAGRAKISGFLNTGGGTPGTSLRFYTMPDEGSVTERMRISSTGNVGIGTTGNPNTIFQVLSSSNNNTTAVEGQTRLFNTFDGGVATIGFSSNSGGNQDGRAGIAAGKDPISGTTGFLAFSVRKDVSTFTEAMRITSASKIGIGTTSPETLFDVADGSSNTLIAVRNTSTANTTGKNAMYGFVGTDTVGTPKLVGGMQAAPNDVNWVNGWLYWYVRSGDGQVLRMSLSNGGALTISGALTQNGSPSDINLKENLVKISSPLDKISQINGYNFEWKEGSPARGNISNIVKDAGVIAQEIEEIMPEIVRISDDNKVVNYNGLIALLIEGMKELKAEFDEYKTTHP